MKKQDLRTEFKKKRAALSPLDLHERSEKICQRLFSSFQLEGKIVSLFLPIEKFKEINTYIILEKGKTIGTRFALPKTNFSNHSLKHYIFESNDQLEITEWGIPEPKSGKVIDSSKIDFVLIPLLTVDHKGHRVGYGKGFYDRFLENCSPHCTFVGLHLFDELSDIEDVGDHDVQLHYCISPEKFWRFEKE